VEAKGTHAKLELAAEGFPSLPSSQFLELLRREEGEEENIHR
jgi:hypothetical protein